MNKHETESIHCIPDEVALKSFFLGPQAENAEWVETEILKIFRQWFAGRRQAFPQDGNAISIDDQNLPEFLERRKVTDQLMQELLLRFERELPKFSPRYIGHMFSEISIPALFGHIMTLLHNPNNISGESSRVGTAIEEEALQFLGQMFGCQKVFGHFTSGGTVANFEALSRGIYRSDFWLLIGLVVKTQKRKEISLMESAHMGWQQAQVYLAEPEIAQQVAGLQRQWGSPFERAELIFKTWGIHYKGPVVLVPAHKHYSWEKGVSLMGLGDEAFWSVPLNRQGVVDSEALSQLVTLARAQNRPVAMLVSVMGTTELGFVDPLQNTVNLLESLIAKEGFHLWHHVDAAYGGFFATMRDSQALGPVLKASLCALKAVDSITVDPHKLGYVPYASGTIVIKGELDYYVRAHLAPYLQYTTKSDRGPYTLEGSRSAAGAVATWLSAKSIGLESSGYGRILQRTIQGKRDLEAKLTSQLSQVSIAPFTELNVMGFVVGKKGEHFSEVQRKTHELYLYLQSEAQKEFIISKTTLKSSSYEQYLTAWAQEMNWQGDITDLELIRICVMNPFFSSKVMRVDFSELFVELIGRAIVRLSLL